MVVYFVSGETDPVDVNFPSEAVASPMALRCLRFEKLGWDTKKNSRGRVR